VEGENGQTLVSIPTLQEWSDLHPETALISTSYASLAVWRSHAQTDRGGNDLAITYIHIYTVWSRMGTVATNNSCNKQGCKAAFYL